MAEQRVRRQRVAGEDGHEISDAERDLLKVLGLPADSDEATVELIQTLFATLIGMRHTARRARPQFAVRLWRLADAVTEALDQQFPESL